MNKNMIVYSCVATLFMMTGRDVIAGDLDPSGPPAPTMKTLNQIEPRTPISSLPYTITEPGSYYVVSNIHSTTHGIVIDASGVTVDLMGFSLTGDGSSSFPHYDTGIHVTGETNAMIEDLLIKGGIVSGFDKGLRCVNMNNSRIEHLRFQGITILAFGLMAATMDPQEDNAMETPFLIAQPAKMEPMASF